MPKLALGKLPPFYFFSIKAFAGKGFSLKTSNRMKLITVRMPKNMKQPSHPDRGRTTELAIIPILAARALAKYTKEYTAEPSLYLNMRRIITYFEP